MDPISTHADYSVIGGKLIIYRKKTPQLGEENPYKLPQQDKKPQFAMPVRSSGLIGLQLRPILLKYSNSLGTTAFFLSLSKARVYYVPARPYQLIAICFVFYILTIPYIPSLIDHYHIRRTSLPLGPLKAQGRFIHLNYWLL